jgi:hypothetical protein
VAIVRRELAQPDDSNAELTSIAELLSDPSIARPGGDPSDALEEANRRLAEHIRNGAADERNDARAVHEFLRTPVERKLAVNNPAFLDGVRGTGP